MNAVHAGWSFSRWFVPPPRRCVVECRSRLKHHDVNQPSMTHNITAWRIGCGRSFWRARRPLQVSSKSSPRQVRCSRHCACVQASQATRLCSSHRENKDSCRPGHLYSWPKTVKTTALMHVLVRLQQIQIEIPRAERECVVLSAFENSVWQAGTFRLLVADFERHRPQRSSKKMSRFVNSVSPLKTCSRFSP